MADDPQREVLSSLPRSRPVRRSSKRSGQATGAPEETGDTRTTNDAAAEPARSTGAKPRPAKRAAPRKKAAAGPKSAGSKSSGRTGAASRPAKPAPPAGWATPEDAGGSPPGGVEVVTTAVRAVGELAQLGAAVGTQAARGLIKRIPKP